MARRKKYIGVFANKTDSAWRGFQNRVDVAQRRGLLATPVLLDRSKQNLERLLRGGPLVGRTWSGKSMAEVEVPHVGAVYDRTYVGTKERPVTEEMIAVLEDEGVPFVNSRDFRKICADKWKTHRVFEEHGTRTPDTVRSSRKNLKRMLDEHGFIFVKKRVASGGRGQAVVKALGKGKVSVRPHNRKRAVVTGSFSEAAD
jgi:hypothetical protein